MTQTGLTQTSRHCACEICGDNSGKCRTNGELHLCMAYAEGLDSDDRWHFHGPSKGSQPGLWGVYTPQRGPRKRDWRETYWEDREKVRRKCEEVVHLPRKRHRPTFRPGFTEAPTCSIQQRHAVYSRLFSGWSLSSTHRRNLSDRFGFPINDDNAHLTGIVSVGPTTKLKAPHPFPGSTGSDHTATFRSGMALSITDEQGRIIGIEERRDDPSLGRYRWLSRPDDCVLGLPEYNNENPLGIYAPFGETDPTGAEYIGICEGRGMKPRIAATKWQMPVIGGGGHAAATGSRIQLNRYLLANPGAIVLLLVDAGGLENAQVKQQLLRTIQFCQIRGHEVLIPWWGQKIAKEDPDPDEVPRLTGFAERPGARYACWVDGLRPQLWAPEQIGLGV